MPRRKPLRKSLRVSLNVIVIHNYTGCRLLDHLAYKTQIPPTVQVSLVLLCARDLPATRPDTVRLPPQAFLPVRIAFQATRWLPLDPYTLDYTNEYIRFLSLLLVQNIAVLI